MKIPTATLASSREQDALSNRGNLDIFLRIEIVNDRSDGDGECEVLAVASVTVLHAPWFTRFRDCLLGISPSGEGAKIGDPLAEHTSAVPAGCSGWAKFHEVLIESNGAVSAVSGRYPDCDVINKHCAPTIPQLPASAKWWYYAGVFIELYV